MKFIEWVNIWLDTYKKPFLVINSLEVINYGLKNHIIPAFGDFEISNIKGYELQSFINTLGKIPNMQDKCRKYLNDILEYAYRNRIIEFNPMLACKFKKYQYENTTPMPMDIRKKFIESLKGQKYELLYLTYLYSGARLSEVISKDCFVPDFENKVLYIHGTKTLCSDRVMPLFNKLATLLKCHTNFKQYFECYKPNYVYLLLKRHLKRVGLDGYCVRSLRSTFSNMCYGLGIREKTVGAWLGHSGSSITAKYYINNANIGMSKDDGILREIQIVNDAL